MYSPALVTSHNIVREPGYRAKILSQKGKIPNPVGQHLRILKIFLSTSYQKDLPHLG